MNIKKEEQRERTIASRFQPKFGPHGSVSRQHAPAQCPVWFARNDLQYIFSGLARFARFGFTNNGLGIARFAWFGSLCSLCSHGSVSEVRTRPGQVLTVRFQKSRLRTRSAITVRFLITRIRHRTARTVRMVHTVWLQTSYFKLIGYAISLVIYIYIASIEHLHITYTHTNRYFM